MGRTMSVSNLDMPPFLIPTARGSPIVGAEKIVAIVCFSPDNVGASKKFVDVCVCVYVFV
jgi:hypothetical protein